MRTVIKLWMFLLTLSLFPIGVFLLLMTLAWSHPGSSKWDLFLLPLSIGIAIWGCSRVVIDGYISWPRLLLAHLPLVTFVIWARFY